MPGGDAVLLFKVNVPGDVDGDDHVNVADLIPLLATWGPCSDPCPPSCPSDFDGNCAVDVMDLLTMLANWE